MSSDVLSDAGSLTVPVRPGRGQYSDRITLTDSTSK